MEAVEGIAAAERAAGTVWVEETRLGAARRAIEGLSRRGRRLGTGPIELREIARAGGRVLVEVRGAAPRVGGYRIVATLYHEGGETTVEPVPGEAPASTSRCPVRGPWCEHCGVRRKRNITYVLLGPDGIVQVGSSCLADFTGERDPVRAVRQAALLAQARGEVEQRGAAEVDDAPAGVVSLERFVERVCSGARTEGFRSRRRAREHAVEATADRAWRSLGEEGRSAADQRRAQAVVAWVRGELAEREERSEYDDRLVWALSRPRLGYGERYLVASALSAYTREFDPHVGRVGEYVELESWVEQVARKGRRGRFGSSFLHRLRDGYGRLLLWWATEKRLERGSRQQLSGTVRRHGRFGEESATVVTRCRATPLE